MKLLLKKYKNFKLLFFAPEKRGFLKSLKNITVLEKNSYPGKARIAINKNIIEIGRQFDQINKTAQMHVILHEVGHYFYKTEIFCDIFALNMMILTGYNLNDCFKAIEQMKNDKRKKVLFFYLTKIIL